MTAARTRRGSSPRTTRARQVDVLRSYLLCATCGVQMAARTGSLDRRCSCLPAARGSVGTGELVSPAAFDVLLMAITRLFDTHVLGQDRGRVAALCSRLTDRVDQRPADGLLEDLSTIEIDLARLPNSRLRQLLDALTIEFHYDWRHGGVQLRAKISQALVASCTAQASLRVEVPAGWPILTPAAARALLRLLTNVVMHRDRIAEHR